MRHLGSIVLSLLLAPLIWVSAGFGLDRVIDGNTAGTDRLASGTLGLVGVVVAGALYALLIMPRLSPVGPALAGVAYLGVTLWPLVDQGSFERAVPESLLDNEDLLRRPVTFGVLGLLAVPLLITLASGRRWRRFVGPDPGTHGTVYGSPTGMDYPAAWSGGDYQPTTPLYPPASVPTSPTPAATNPPPVSTWPPPAHAPGGDNDPTRRL